MIASTTPPTMTPMRAAMGRPADVVGVVGGEDDGEDGGEDEGVGDGEGDGEGDGVGIGRISERERKLYLKSELIGT